MVTDNGLTITMPFYFLKRSNEVQIEGLNLYYSEANIYTKSMGYGLQLNDEENREEVKALCFEISKKVKELNELVNNNK